MSLKWKASTQDFETRITLRALRPGHHPAAGAPVDLGRDGGSVSQGLGQNVVVEGPGILDKNAV